MMDELRDVLRETLLPYISSYVTISLQYSGPAGFSIQFVFSIGVALEVHNAMEHPLHLYDRIQS